MPHTKFIKQSLLSLLIGQQSVIILSIDAMQIGIFLARRMFSIPDIYPLH